MGEDDLEELAATIEATYTSADGEVARHVPIAVVRQADLRRPLRDLLADLEERDSVMPEKPAQPRAPLIMLSGFAPVATSATVRALRSLGLRGGTSGVRPMFAVAVPNALSKTLEILIDEIEGDHLANAERNSVNVNGDGDGSDSNRPPSAD